MSIMDLKRIMKDDVELLVPGSHQIIRNIGLKRKLMPISPKERALIFMFPRLSRRDISPYCKSGELYLKKKDEEIRRIKQVIEMSVERAKSKKLKSFLYPNKTPDELSMKRHEEVKDSSGTSGFLKKSEKAALFPYVRLKRRLPLNHQPFLFISNKLPAPYIPPILKDAIVSTENEFD